MNYFLRRRPKKLWTQRPRCIQPRASLLWGGGGVALREIQKTAARETNLEQSVQNSRLKVAVHYEPVLVKCLESLMHLLLIITRECKQEQRSDDDARTTIVSQIGCSFHRSFLNQSKTRDTVT